MDGEWDRVLAARGFAFARPPSAGSGAIVGSLDSGVRDTIFGFGKKKRAEDLERVKHRLVELRSERDALRTELAHLTEKLNVQLKDKATDKTTTLSRYPTRIVDLKIQIDELDRKISGLEGRIKR